MASIFEKAVLAWFLGERKQNVSEKNFKIDDPNLQAVPKIWMQEGNELALSEARNIRIFFDSC